MSNKITKISDYLLLAIYLIIIIGSAIYYLYKLNIIGVFLTLILAIIGFIIIFWLTKRYLKLQLENEASHLSAMGKKYWPIIEYILIFLYLFGVLICFFIIYHSQTAQAIISPWQVIPKYFFLLYGLTTLILIFYLLKRRPFSLILISIHFFLSFSIAWLVYKIGYGFDPFIHRATLNLIDKYGAVEPKTFYYLGQYAFIIILHKITFLPIVWLDKLLVPAVAAIFLPITLYQALKKWFTDDVKIYLTILALLIIPFNYLIVTTPQNLAYIFFIIILLLGLKCKNIFDLILIYSLTLAAIAIHPLAGIPALLFTLGLTVFHSDRVKLKKYFYFLIFISLVLLLPVTFYFLNKNNAPANSSVLEPAANSSSLISPSIFINPGQENFILNFIYLYFFNWWLIFLVLFLVGLVIAWQNRAECKILFWYLFTALGLSIAYILTLRLPFNFLIAYERTNYAERILLLIAFCLLPFVLIAIYGLLINITKQNIFIRSAFITFLVILICTALYVAYPRLDNYYNSHGFSISQDDLEAVHWIESDAKGTDFIVLANQQTSAAALNEFGFKKYYPSTSSGQATEIFYYPVPTGGPLYQYYLDMVYNKPTKETMRQAMDLAGVKLGYFVLNKYWWAFPKVLAEAKLEADSYEAIDKRAVYVLKYKY